MNKGGAWRGRLGLDFYESMSLWDILEDLDDKSRNDNTWNN